MWVGYAPSDPGAWQAFLSIPPIVRESTNYFYYQMDISAQTGTWVFFAYGLIGIMVAMSPMWLRARFFYFHAAFLIFICGVVGQRVPAYSISQSDLNSTLSLVLDLSGFSMITFFLLIVSCLDAHRRMLIRFRPKRDGQL